MSPIHSTTTYRGAPVFAFAQAIKAAGLQPPETVYADGLLHRFSTSGKRGDFSGWYVLHDGAVPAGVFGCWRAGLTETWSSKHEHTLTYAECSMLRQRIKVAKALRDADTLQRQQQTQVAATKKWEVALPVGQHAYLTAKGVQGYKLRADGEMLLVPLHDTNGMVHSVQSITPQGHKRFMTGGRVRGCYYGLGQASSVWVVCEGVATAHSIHEATNLTLAAAFSASNLMPVAQALKQKNPECTIIIAADDDHLTEGNPGLTAARAAAMAVGGLVVMPQFPANRPGKATDFNDLSALAGTGVVHECFAEVMEGLSHDL